MSKQIQSYTPQIAEAFPAEVLNVIRNSICPTANDAEFVLFAHKAASFGLDPFKNEIFFIKYGNTARIQFAAEAYLSKAREKDGFQPPDTQTVCDNDTFKAKKVRGENGSSEWEIEVHEVTFPRGKIIGAYSIAYRDGYRPVTVFVEKEHISHMYKGQNKDNWEKWESDMIGKFAEQRALKKQYGLNFDSDGIEGDGIQPSIHNVEPYRQDVTPPDAPQAAQSDSKPKRDTKPRNVVEADTEPTEAEKAAVKNMVGKNFELLGITDQLAVRTYISEVFPDLAAGAKLTYDQQKKLIEHQEKQLTDLPEELA